MCILTFKSVGECLTSHLRVSHLVLLCAMDMCARFLLYLLKRSSHNKVWDIILIAGKLRIFWRLDCQNLTTHSYFMVSQNYRFFFLFFPFLLDFALPCPPRNEFLHYFRIQINIFMNNILEFGVVWVNFDFRIRKIKLSENITFNRKYPLGIWC